MEEKIKDALKLEAIVEDLKRQGKRIVFTNGCFDLIHRGHIHCLKKAKSLGDILIVALNSDSSVKALKGSPRPILSQEDRAEIISALSCVDYVVIFDEMDPLNLIRILKPQVLVKGGDYAKEEIIGAKEVEEQGGQVVLIPFLEGHSTSYVLGKIKQAL